jgi:catechol 2,3-dioxygenase-like lactoylglutathione lyase family enzyme
LAKLYLDHVLIAVKSLSKASEAFDRLGFTITPEGVHPGRGTHNRLIVFGPGYLELIAIRDPNEGVFRKSMVEFLKPALSGVEGTREGLYMFAIGTPDIHAGVAAMRERGVQVGDPQEGSRQGSGGSPGYSWHAVRVPAEATPGSETFLIQHHSTIEQRYTVPAGPTRHANGAKGIHRLALAVADVNAAAASWQRLLGASPKAMSDADGGHCARFELGETYLDLIGSASAPAGFPALLTLGVANLKQTADFLKTRGVPARSPEGKEGKLVAVEPEHASGVALQFVQAR